MTPLARTLIGAALPAELEMADLARAYAWETGVRALMLSTLDGVVTGSDGRSGSLGTPADKAAFDTLRSLCDVIVVGAGTARIEGYGPPPPGKLLVVVSRTGDMPEKLRERRDDVILATVTPSPEGGVQRWVFPGDSVSPHEVRRRLVAEGRPKILLEGGPRLLGEWLVAGQVDELCLTQVPVLRGAGRPLLPVAVGSVTMRPHVLLEADGALLGRWRVTGINRE